MTHRLKPEDVIIKSPHRLRLPHHLTGASLTMFFWGIMLWLCQPLFTLAAWHLNIGNAHEQMAEGDGWQALITLIFVYGMTIVVMCSTLLIWAKIQQWRFRGKEKRKWPDALSNEQVASWFGTDPFARRHWMRLRHSNAYFNEATHALTIRPRNAEGEEIAMDYIYTAIVQELTVAHAPEVYDDFRHDEPLTE